MVLRTATALIAVVGGAACAPPPDGSVPTRIAGLVVARMASWPAGGHGLTLRIEDDDGFFVRADRSAEIGMAWPGTSPRAMVVRRTELSPGYTLVLWRPAADEARAAEQAEAIGALIAARPAGEAIALYRWAARAEQLAEFTTDRDELAWALARGGRASAAVAPAQDVYAEAVAIASAVGGPEPPGLRSVVIVADDVAGALPEGVSEPAVVQWVVAGQTDADADRVGRGRLVRVEDHADLLDAVVEASARLDELAALGHYELALCAPLEGADVRVTLGERALAVEIPAVLPEQRLGTCDPEALGPRGYPPSLDFVFTAAQRAIYDDRVAALSEDDFELSVRLDPAQPPASATAHLRGKGSLTDCVRKSYAVDFDSPRPRYLIPGAALDEYYVISMCLDDRYIRNATVYRAMSWLGLFPMRFRYVPLALDGAIAGAYLAIEQPKGALLRDHAGVTAVIRRRFEDRPATSLDIKFARDGVDRAAADYWAVLQDTAGLSGRELERALESRLDLEGYLTLLALHTALHNGDYVDETWLLGSERVRDDGSVGTYYRFIGWDPEDVFTECHYTGRYAFVDPHDIAYCAEAELDHLILGDPHLYDRYVATVERLLTTDLPPERFDESLALTEAELLPLLEDPALVAALRELLESNPAAIDPAVAQQDVRDHLAALGQLYRDRREVLLARIAAYRGP